MTHNKFQTRIFILLFLFGLSAFTVSRSEINIAGFLNTSETPSLILTGDSADFIWNSAAQHGIDVADSSDDSKTAQTVSYRGWSCERILKIHSLGETVIRNWLRYNLSEFDGNTMCSRPVFGEAPENP